MTLIKLKNHGSLLDIENIRAVVKEHTGPKDARLSLIKVTYRDGVDYALNYGADDTYYTHNPEHRNQMRRDEDFLQIESILTGRSLPDKLPPSLSVE